MKRHWGRESETKGRMRWNCVRIGILMWQALEEARNFLQLQVLI
jgi:hypothetical protein